VSRIQGDVKGGFRSPIRRAKGNLKKGKMVKDRFIKRGEEKKIWVLVGRKNRQTLWGEQLSSALANKEKTVM